VTVDSAEAVGPAWDAALAADRPILIHAVVDPAVPLLPPRLESAMREKMLAGLARRAEAEGAPPRFGSRREKARPVRQRIR
jgi:pyruvate dehydrogenase (quinone)